MFLTNTRKPLDHFISGAILSVLVTNKKQNPGNIVKTALQGGLGASFAISASNNIANKEYANALMCIGIGVYAVTMIENIFNKKEKNEQSKNR